MRIRSYKQMKSEFSVFNFSFQKIYERNYTVMKDNEKKINTTEEEKKVNTAEEVKTEETGAELTNEQMEQVSAGAYNKFDNGIYYDDTCYGYKCYGSTEPTPGKM